MLDNAKDTDLRGWMVVLTRPAGMAATLARQVRARGGVPLLLPGLALRPPDDLVALGTALEEALAAADILIFSSPAAVRYAARLRPLRSTATVLAVGQATAQQLRRCGLTQVLIPARYDSEGVLAEPVLQDVHGRRIALIGAAGGRGLLSAQLRARGAQLCELHVYKRQPPRLSRRHTQALLRMRPPWASLFSSAEALTNVRQALPAAAWAMLAEQTVIVSSQRLYRAAQAAGCQQVFLAASAYGPAMLDAVANIAAVTVCGFNNHSAS